MGKGKRIRTIRKEQRADREAREQEKRALAEKTASEFERMCRAATHGAIRQLARNYFETGIQYACDTLSLALNDPKIMGKDTFGETRLVRLLEAWTEYYEKFLPAIDFGPESAAYQWGLDQRLNKIFKKHTDTFEERYDKLVPIDEVEKHLYK